MGAKFGNYSKWKVHAISRGYIKYTIKSGTLLSQLFIKIVNVPVLKFGQNWNSNHEKRKSNNKANLNFLRKYEKNEKTLIKFIKFEIFIKI